MRIRAEIAVATLMVALPLAMARAEDGVHPAPVVAAEASQPATQPAVPVADREAIYLRIAKGDRTMAAYLNRRSAASLRLRELLARGLGQKHPDVVTAQQNLKVSQQQVSNYADKFLEKNPDFLTVRPDSASSQPAALVAARRMRHFVQIVISPGGAITFQGAETDWDQLPTLLQQLPDRSHTVLCLGASSDDVTLGQYHSAMTQSTRLVSQFGFESLSEKPEDKDLAKVSEVVRAAITTISGGIEGDPNVTKALETLREFDNSEIVAETAHYLASEDGGTRRAAVYALWRGEFKSIDAAIDPLIQACKHKEDLTRGMAALALGANHAGGGKSSLIEMATTDRSPYARRCAAYALGLLGDPNAMPTLQKVESDADPLVAYNAKAAIKMLDSHASPATQPG